jgi:hypothetical protein
MAAEQRKQLLEECYRRADEAHRMANAPGVPPEQKADLLVVEQRWLSLARACQTAE